MSRFCDKPKGEIPYIIPKFTSLALLLISEVTLSNGTPKTLDAVIECMSLLFLNAFIISGSPLKDAIILSSI